MESLLRTVKRLESYDATAFSESVVATGTGFSGSSRANLRSLCSLTGIKYCGDLISGWSTHLIVADNNFNGESSKKMQVAAKWGVPIVRLQWLLDSIQQGEPLCEDAYLIHISRTDTTPAAKAVHAPRPLSSSKQGSNSAPNRTPLRSVENVTENFTRLTVTPKESGNHISPAAAAAEIVVEENAAPNPVVPLTEEANTEGETPSASPCRTELPSEITVVIGCYSPSLKPATELETEDEDESQQIASAPPAAATKQKSVPQWWDSQDSVWVPGSQPRTVDISLLPEPSLEEEEKEESSFSFVNAAAAATTPSETAPLLLPSPLAVLPEEEEEKTPNDPSSCSTTNLTPMSDMTPLDLQPPDMTRTRILDSPNFDRGGHDGAAAENNVDLEAYFPNTDNVEILQIGGQPEPEWWEEDEEEEDWRCVDIIDETCGGNSGGGGECSSPLQETHNDKDGDEGEEPSPVSKAGSNHENNDKLPQHQEIEDSEDFSENQITAHARAPLPPLPPLPSGLPQPEDDAVPLKVLQRAPRGSTVKARYRLAHTKAVTFVEMIHLRGKQLTLNVKDKQQAILLAPLSDPEKDSTDDEEKDEENLILAEPLSFYQCQGEDTQMEYNRLYTGSQALALAEKAGAQLRLPPGFDASVELLKGTAREHADLRRVQGTVAVRRAKLGVNALKTKCAQGGKPIRYWRCELDAQIPEILMP